jgi:hypothetical protein
MKSANRPVTSAESGQTDTHVANLLRLSYNEIRRRGMAFMYAAVAAWLTGVENSGLNASVFYFLTFVWWLKVVAQSSGARQEITGSQRPTKDFLLFLNALALGGAVVLVAFGVGSLLVLSVPFFKTARLLAFEIGLCVAVALLLRVIFILPTIAFGRSASLAQAWSLSRHCFWKLISGISLIGALMTSIILAVLVCLGEYGSLAKGIILVATTGADVLGTGYVAHAYLAALRNADHNR